MPKKGSKKITVLIADDEPVSRAGIRTLLAQATDLEIVGEAKDGFEAQEMVPKLRPKILLLDYKMPGPRPRELEEWVRTKYPETATLILTAHDRDAYLAGMINSGIAGYLLKGQNPEQLINAIRRAAEGTVYFSDEQIARAQKWKETVQEKWQSLTERERELLRHLAMGDNNKTISKVMNITLKTVEFHMSNILKKLSMDSRDQVIVWMLEHRPDDSNNIKD